MIFGRHAGQSYVAEPQGVEKLRKLRSSHVKKSLHQATAELFNFLKLNLSLKGSLNTRFDILLKMNQS